MLKYEMKSTIACISVSWRDRKCSKLKLPTWHFWNGLIMKIQSIGRKPKPLRCYFSRWRLTLHP